MIPQHITYGQGGTISIQALERFTTPTVTIKTDRNEDIVSAQAATQSTVNTTLSSAASAGATTIAVAAATGIAADAVLDIGSGDESVVVKSISGTTVTLVRPLIVDHASAATVKNNTLSYTVSSSDASKLFWDGAAYWYNNGVLYTQTPVECTRYPLFRLTTLQDVWDEHPQLRDLLSSNDDPNRLLNMAHNDVMTAIAAVDRARAFYASGREIARAVVFQFLLNYYRHDASESATLLYDRYQFALSNELQRIISILPRDADQDQIIEAGEKMRANCIRIIRA